MPFPEVEFQSFLTQIAEKKPDGVFAFFAGGGAVKFVKDYAAAGLRKSVPLYGPGFLTDGTLPAQGDAADGLKTTLHYADDLDNPADKAFRAAYQKRYGAEPDVYAVQGYDAAALLVLGMDAAKGDVNAKDPHLQGDARCQDQLAARTDDHVGRQQSDPEHLSARGQERQERLREDRGGSALRSRHWLQDGVRGWPLRI